MEANGLTNPIDHLKQEKPALMLKRFGNAFYWMRAVSAARKGHAEKTLSMLQKLVEQDYLFLRKLALMSWAYIELGEYEQAEACCLSLRENVEQLRNSSYANSSNLEYMSAVSDYRLYLCSKYGTTKRKYEKPVLVGLNVWETVRADLKTNFPLPRDIFG